MKLAIRISLYPSPEQFARLRALQVAFAQVCNALAPIVQQSRVWNRVALHHLTYRQLRDRFPAIGSQMVCNAIYSVSRACRAVYQNPSSPFSLAKLNKGALPLLRFSDESPVFFDRHTLSLKSGRLSLYTLDGRMRFDLSLKPEEEAAFHSRKLREIVLLRRGEDGFELIFWLGAPANADAQAVSDGDGDGNGSAPEEIPEYVMVEEAT